MAFVGRQGGTRGDKSNYFGYDGQTAKDRARKR
jgi:hypothetical protein